MMDMDMPHAYQRSFTCDNMRNDPDGGTPVEICERCGTTREIGNHYAAR